MAARDSLCFVFGLGFLFLTKAKNVLRGYSSPKPFDIAQTERSVSYDMQVVEKWLSYLGNYLNSDGEVALRGRDVLELGSGSDLGVGLYLLSKGTSTYSAAKLGVRQIGAIPVESSSEQLRGRIGFRDSYDADRQAAADPTARRRNPQAGAETIDDRTDIRVRRRKPIARGEVESGAARRRLVVVVAIGDAEADGELRP